jgi:hypothetical protein
VRRQDCDTHHDQQQVSRPGVGAARRPSRHHYAARLHPHGALLGPGIGGCCNEQSAEHLISKAMIVGKPVRVQGAAWRPDDRPISAATAWEADGHEDRVVTALLGHGDLGSTARYV